MSYGARKIRISGTHLREWKIVVRKRLDVHLRATRCAVWTWYAFNELAAKPYKFLQTHRRHLQSELFVLLFHGERAPLSGQRFRVTDEGSHLSEHLSRSESRERRLSGKALSRPLWASISAVSFYRAAANSDLVSFFLAKCYKLNHLLCCIRFYTQHNYGDK